jgi:hypothetical protein
MEKVPLLSPPLPSSVLGSSSRQIAQDFPPLYSSFGLVQDFKVIQLKNYAAWAGWVMRKQLYWESWASF